MFAMYLILKGNETKLVGTYADLDEAYYAYIQGENGKPYYGARIVNTESNNIVAIYY